MPFLSKTRALCGAAAAAAVAALAVGAGAGTANAATGGTPGWYQLCSYGSYASEVLEPPTPGGLQGFNSIVVYPGRCTPIYLSGGPANIYGFNPDGSRFYIGTQWWEANINTDGVPGQANYFIS
jgi:hypothetical protein